MQLDQFIYPAIDLYIYLLTNG